MKKYSILLILLIILSCISYQNDIIKNKKYNFTIDHYGLFEQHEYSKSNKFQDIDIITESIINEDIVLKIKKNSKNIKIEIGVDFGIDFSVYNLENPKNETVTIRIIHPLIKNPKTMKESTVDTFDMILHGKNNNQVGWLIEHDWEVVKGKWIFEVYYKNEKMLSQNFITY